MTEWRPKPPWFAEHAPRIAAAARRARARPEVAAVLERNFPGGA
jgi:hypothetical protein